MDKLEEIKTKLEEWNIAYTDHRPFRRGRVDDVLMEDAEPDVLWLISEVARLRNQAQQTNRDWRDNHVYLLERAEKAEADAELFGENLNRLGDFYKQYRKKAKARIKELEQELLWAADACEKVENLPAEKEKV